MDITKKNLTYFKAAGKIALLSTFHKGRGVQVGCVIVYRNHIISSGFNSDKTDPVQMKYNRYRFINNSSPHTIHAEINAIKPIMNRDIDWSSVEIYITRVLRKDGSFAMARPCPSCMKLICDMGIHKVFYTTDIGYAFEII